MEHRLKSGRVVTDEELERDAEMWENDTWEGGFAEVRIGRPRYSDEELGVVTFKAPLSKIAIMERKASEHGMSKSEFMRNALEMAIA